MLRIKYLDLFSKTWVTGVFDSENERDEFIEYGDMVGHLSSFHVKYL